MHELPNFEAGRPYFETAWFISDIFMTSINYFWCWIDHVTFGINCASWLTVCQQIVDQRKHPRHSLPLWVLSSQGVSHIKCAAGDEAAQEGILQMAPLYI